MKVLAIDTTLEACQAAVIDGARVLASRSEPMQRGHQERLAPLVQQAMADSGMVFKALERIAVTVGPGSFTGLRVGLAFAKGLGLALGIPCVGVRTMQALAAGQPGRLAVALDARREQVYLQLFEDGDARSQAMALSFAEASDRVRAFAEAGPTRLIGSGAPLLEAGLQASPAQVDPVMVARLAAREGEPLAPPHPFYLRAPDARLPA